MTSSKEDDQRWMDGLTEGELHRLRSFQLSGRINETLIEGKWIELNRAVRAQKANQAQGGIAS